MLTGFSGPFVYDSCKHNIILYCVSLLATSSIHHTGNIFHYN